MVQLLIIDFPQNICDYDYYIIHLLCGKFMSLHCSMLSARCIKATVPSIRYFNWEILGCFFVLLFGNLHYIAAVKFVKISYFILSIHFKEGFGDNDMTPLLGIVHKSVVAC